MKTIVKLLGGAALLACAAGADAATYFRYSFETTGTGYSSFGMGESPIVDATFNYVVPASGESTNYNGGFSTTFLSSPLQVFLQPTTVTVHNSTSFGTFQGTGELNSIELSAVYKNPDNYPGLPIRGFGESEIDAAQSFVRYVNQRGAEFQTYSGNVTAVRFSLFEGADFGVPRGLVSITNNVAAVPEPATWAMMLVGFAMVAGAARYRRRAATVSFG